MQPQIFHHEQNDPKVLVFVRGINQFSISLSLREDRRRERRPFPCPCKITWCSGQASSKYSPIYTLRTKHGTAFLQVLKLTFQLAHFLHYNLSGSCGPGHRMSCRRGLAVMSGLGHSQARIRYVNHDESFAWSVACVFVTFQYWCQRFH